MSFARFAGIGLLFAVAFNTLGLPALRWFLSLPSSVQVACLNSGAFVCGIALLWWSRGDDA